MLRTTKYLEISLGRLGFHRLIVGGSNLFSMETDIRYMDEEELCNRLMLDYFRGNGFGSIADAFAREQNIDESQPYVLRRSLMDIEREEMALKKDTRRSLMDIVREEMALEKDTLLGEVIDPEMPKHSKPERSSSDSAKAISIKGKLHSAKNGDTH